jgi:hypothetical protein
VEQYFNAYKTQPEAYWQGISRANETEPFTYLDSMPVFENVSNVPYAHWAWWHPTHKRNSSYSCAMASKALQFEYYSGNSSLEQQVSEHFCRSAFPNSGALAAVQIDPCRCCMLPFPKIQAPDDGLFPKHGARASAQPAQSLGARPLAPSPPALPSGSGGVLSELGLLWADDLRLDSPGMR